MPSFTCRGWAYLRKLLYLCLILCLCCIGQAKKQPTQNARREKLILASFLVFPSQEENHWGADASKCISPRRHWFASDMPLMIRHAFSVRLHNSNHQYCCSSSKDRSQDFIVKISSAKSKSLSRACLWYCIMYRPQQAYRCRCNTLCRLRSKPDPRLAQAKTEKFMGWADERNVQHGKNIQRSRVLTVIGQ